MRSDEEAPECGDALGREWHEAADHILICEGRFRGEADMHGRVASLHRAWMTQLVIRWSIFLCCTTRGIARGRSETACYLPYTALADEKSPGHELCSGRLNFGSASALVHRDARFY
jgi:hypothetical protein